MGKFGAALYGVLKKWGIEILAALGISMLTMTGVDYVFQQMTTQLVNNFNAMPTDVIQILSLSGFGVAFNIILGAVSARIAIDGVSKLKAIKK